MGYLFGKFEYWMTGVSLLTIIGWVIYRILKYPKQTKRDIFFGICCLLLLLGSYSCFYWIYTFFVGGFDLKVFWYITLIPLTIGSTIIPFFKDDKVYPFWSTLKKRITTSGYLLIIWGIGEFIQGTMNGTLTEKINLFLIPVLCGLIPVIIDVYQQKDV